jgi:hypothetical protein
MTIKQAYDLVLTMEKFKGQDVEFILLENGRILILGP